MRTFHGLWIFVLLLSQTTFATEGFFNKSTDMPPAVTSAWDSVFGFYYERTPGMNRHGTFSFIGTRGNGAVVTAYFLGAYHVVEKLCPDPGPCARANLAQEYEEIEPRLSFSLEGLKALFAPIRTRASGMMFDSVNLVDRRKDLDLVLLSVEVDAQKIQSLKRIPISQDCVTNHLDQVYSVGFSTILDRWTWKRNKPKDSAITHKRWSVGRMDGLQYQMYEGKKVYVYGSSVDLLPGGSGGPLLNRAGEIIGVEIECQASDEDLYVSKAENFRRVMPESYATTCEEIQEFIKAIP